MVKTTTISYNATRVGEVYRGSFINIIEFSEVFSQRHYSSVPSSMSWIWAERARRASRATNLQLYAVTRF